MVTGVRSLFDPETMNRLDIQQNAMVGCEEMRGSVSVPLSVSDVKGPVVCPKPRRVGFLANHPPMSLRWCKRSIQGEQSDTKAGPDLLDLILTKDGYGVDFGSSPPPFFTGSPPTRVSNPLVQDSNFTDEKLSPLSTLQHLPSPSSSSSPLSSPSARKGGCARIKFGFNPAPVRVEGFDCLSRDRQNSGITAVA
ncbi:hypothetical protein V2J09_023333 [Rumex salicifolius]